MFKLDPEKIKNKLKNQSKHNNNQAQKIKEKRYFYVET
jgi:hypothetical protein